MSRTTIVLDVGSEEALQALTRHYGCSASEAIRRSLPNHRHRILGVSQDKRRRRVAAFEKLAKLVEGSARPAGLRASKKMRNDLRPPRH